MNIHQNTGAVLQIPLNTIDSITYTLVYTPGPGVTDIDGNTYPSVIYPNGQEWMTENLRTATYSNGDPIPSVANMTEWCALTAGAWVHYNEDAQYEIPYGKLYNWYAVDDARNVCPTGWHVPSDAEWTALVDLFGGSQDAGGKLKTVGTANWSSPNVGATNESGFAGIGGSFAHGITCNFGTLNVDGIWWTSTPWSTTGAWFFLLAHYYAEVGSGTQARAMGSSVRCVRD